eukprot:423108_1
MLSWTTYVEGTITCLTIVHHTILIAKTFLQNKELTATTKHSHKDLRIPLFRVVLLVLLCNLLWNVINIFILFFQLNHHIFGCQFFYGVIMTIYYIGKCSVWYYNVLRLETVFHGTQNLNYNPTLLKSLKISFIITAILLSSACIIGMVPYQNSQGQCVLLFELWANATICIPDAILSCLCYWLFHKKMKLLTKLYQNTMKQSADEIQQSEQTSGLDSQLLYLLRKYAILCATTIVSTWFCAGIAIFVPDMAMVMGSFDSIINVWCILLYDRRYNNLYLKMFGCVAKREWAIVSEMRSTITDHQSEKTSTEHVKSGDTQVTISPDPNSNTVQVTIQ